MASLHALCSICEKNVTAYTLLSDDKIKLLLDRNEEIVVLHHFGDESGNRLHHRWSLAENERKNLRKLIDVMVREKARLGHRS
jgi:hypothetical protein